MQVSALMQRLLGMQMLLQTLLQVPSPMKVGYV
jgi:hypothetical protein